MINGNFPRPIIWRAAFLRSERTYRFIILVLVTIIVVQEVLSRQESIRLMEMVREKEYIIVLGVLGVTTALPNNITDKELKNSLLSLLELITNIDYQNIESKHQRFQKYLSPSLRTSFMGQSRKMVKKFKKHSISEIMHLDNFKITSPGKYFYQVKATVKIDVNFNDIKAGSREEVILMDVKIVRPSPGEFNFLQLTKLKRFDPRKLQEMEDLQ
ncbi:MAG: hypothetical protein H8D23_20520 [Candidatus Brocadiales bacterium]|nr:hypothetical protein [Candidatus Brocadiales bacterium]